MHVSLFDDLHFVHDFVIGFENVAEFGSHVVDGLALVHEVAGLDFVEVEGNHDLIEVGFTRKFSTVSVGSSSCSIGCKPMLSLNFTKNFIKLILYPYI